MYLVPYQQSQTCLRLAFCLSVSQEYQFSTLVCTHQPDARLNFVFAWVIFVEIMVLRNSQFCGNISFPHFLLKYLSQMTWYLVSSLISASRQREKAFLFQVTSLKDPIYTLAYIFIFLLTCFKNFYVCALLKAKKVTASRIISFGQRLGSQKLIYLTLYHTCYFRYLYFNYREAVRDEEEDDDYFSLNSDLHVNVIDLQTLQMVHGVTYEGHKGYSEYPAWYICLDTSDDIVARLAWYYTVFTV